jgi:membrane protease YdiL (CAAX protease family)
MSVHDPLPEPPEQPREPVVPLPDNPVSRPPTEYQQAVPADSLPADVPPEWRPEPPLEERSVVRKPERPHPGLGFSLLWLLLFVLVTQGSAAVLIVGLIVIKALLAPNTQAYLNQFANTQQMQQSPEFASVMWPGMLVCEMVSILMGWLALRLVVGPNWPRQVALRRPSFAHFVLALMLYPAIVCLAGMVEMIVQRLGVPHLINMEDTLKVTGWWPWWLAVLIIGLGPGLGEELWCRAFLGRGLLGNYGVVVGILLTSLLFGIMHIEPHQVIYAPVIGAVLHYVYWTTRSLWLPMMLHTLNNSIAVLAISRNAPFRDILEKADQVLESPSGANAFLVFGAAIVLLLTVGYALYQSRARLEDEDPLRPGWRPDYPSVAYPPLDSGTRMVHPRPSPGILALALLGFLTFVAVCVWVVQQ